MAIPLTKPLEVPTEATIDESAQSAKQAGGAAASPYRPGDAIVDRVGRLRYSEALGGWKLVFESDGGLLSPDAHKAMTIPGHLADTR